LTAATRADRAHALASRCVSKGARAAFFFARRGAAMRYHRGHECVAANDDAP